MAEHQIVKPEKLAATAVGMLEQELVIPNLFQKEGIDQFKGADNDTVSVKVEGVLPFHDYAFRNDRSAPIVFDEYKERKIAVTFGGNVYSAVKVTDEQNDFDLDDWGKLLRPQVKAVGRGLQRRAVSTLLGQDYAVTIGGAEANLRGAIIEARRVLNKLNVPDDQRYLLVGSDFESALLSDDKLNLAQNVGDSEAESALQTATITNRFGFKIVVDQTIPSDAAFAFAGSAFVFLSGAPSVPQSVPYGATQSFEGIALRWVRDYDPTYMQDRSVVNTYAGFRAVTDVLLGWDEANNREVVSAGEHFVRGIKLTLGGASEYPAVGSELQTITGLTERPIVADPAA
ncbi:major capsid protein [Streptomyces phage Saftant]|uniref:Major capsid protein n=1 Tax=Streptomyces phage Saftant TaxID=2601693 RepID=A0A5J6D891_9CAUD|nr:major head protein [Streptomyces phage Saftant]QEQ94042.1 major capsid protein [Streptomyces phage Saftant]